MNSEEQANHIAMLEAMLTSRTKEVDDWIARYDKNITKQRDIIQEQAKRIESLEACEQLARLPLDVQDKLARLTKLGE